MSGRAESRPNLWNMKTYYVYILKCNEVNQAIYFEKKIKKWSAKKKFALANGHFDLLQLLTECRNNSHYKNIGLDLACTERRRSTT